VVVTMKDIAREAKVSRPTVSMILNGRDSEVRISEETRKRVLETARVLDYRRNEIARSMVTGKTNFIGFMDAEITTEYTAKTLSGAVDEAEKHKYFMKIFPYHHKELFKGIVDSALEQRPAGIICRSLDEELLEYLHSECVRFDIPLVVIGSGFFHDWGIRVATDDLAGAELAVRHLIDLGHRRIAHVSLERGRGFVEARREGYIRAMSNAGLKTPDEYFMHEEKLDCIETRIGGLFSGKNSPSAIFCSSDSVAMVILRSLRKTGLSVPGDVSVVGYADLEMARLADPPLSTVTEPFKEVGRTAIKALISEIESKEKVSFCREIRIMLDVKLAARESSAPLK